MANARDFRRIALSLAGTETAPHFDRTAFRVARIYATLPREGDTANLLFSTEEQDRHCEESPQAFAPVAGGWGRMGYTTVTLKQVTVAELREALQVAWERAQPRARKRTPKPAAEAPSRASKRR